MSRALANKTFIVLVVLGLCFLLVGVAVVLVGIGSVKRLSAEQKAAKQQVREIQAAIQGQNIESLRRRKAELSKLLSVLGEEVESEEYVPTLLEQIETLAWRTGNDIKETRPGEYRKGKLIPGTEIASAEKEQKTGDQGNKQQGKEAAPVGGQRYNELEIQLRIAGSYKSTFELIQRLGFLRKMIYVRNITFRKNQALILRPDGQYEGDVLLDMTAYVTEKAKGFPLTLEFTVH